MIEDNINLVYKTIHRYFPSTVNVDMGVYDMEDLVQIGCMALIKAEKNFDESLGYQFSTYAVRAIRGEISRFLKDKINKGRVKNKKVTSIVNMEDAIYTSNKNGDEITFHDNIGCAEFEDYIISEMYIKKFIETLTEREREVLTMRLNGISQRQIGVLIKCSQPLVGRILRSIKHKYKLYKKNAEYTEIKRKYKHVRCVETGVVYNSAMDAEKKTGINRQNIGKVARKERNQAGGFRWEFV